MMDPFIGEIALVAFNFAPEGWAFCNGQTLDINSNQALFSLLGITYGGNGTTTFCLPDLRGRAAIHDGGVSDNIYFGQKKDAAAPAAGTSPSTLTLNYIIALQGIYPPRP